MRHIDEIIVHCSATRPEWMQGRPTSEKVAEIRRWHVQGNGWSDIGYHEVIDRDGTRYPGRPEYRSGAHTRGHNSDTLGVCLLGGHGSSETDSFSENFTEEQWRALHVYISDKQAEFPAIKKISGHNQYAAKACPGFDVDAFLYGEPEPEPVPHLDTAAEVLAIIDDHPTPSPWARFFSLFQRG